MTDIIAIPAFQDNYLWLLIHSNKREAVVVDPGDAEPVMEQLNALGLELTGILLTHQHHDHVGGVETLLAHWNCPVYGPKTPSIPWVTYPVEDGDEISIIEQCFTVLSVPGHTKEHVAYVSEGRLFCGDTLFAGGCGRLLGGTAEMLHASLQKIAALPASTEIYCAHEYTLNNLCFAKTVDSNNTDLDRRLVEVEACREARKPTVPSILSEELKTNPFLRCGEALVRDQVMAACDKTLKSELDVFKAMRLLKDIF